MTRRSLLIVLTFLCCVPSAHATPSWMDTYHDVGGIYAYGEADTLAVFLDGIQCANQKNYYLISPTYVDNAKQLITMVLTAKASGKKIRFFVESSIDTLGCYVKGVWVYD